MASHDPIVGIEVFTASLPLAQPFRHASSGLVDRLDEVVVKVRTRSGAVGYGEVRGNAPYVTGETQARVVAALSDVLAPRLVAAELSAPRAIVRFLDAAIVGNETAKAAIDVAVHDAKARALGVPVQTLLGGGGVTTIATHATLPFCPPEEAAARAVAYVELGLRKIKVRVGAEPFAVDVDRLEAVARALAGHPRGAGVALAVDANQAWPAKVAVARCKRLAAVDLAWIEQPVAAGDVDGLRAVRRAVDTLVIADESCGTPVDLLRLIAAEAVDGIHVKLCKAGGIGRLMAMLAIAEAKGLAYMVGQMDEGMLATAAGLHCAAAAVAPLSCELWGYQRVASQPFRGLEMRDGLMHLPHAPGLGIDVDEAGLQRVAAFGAG